MLPKCSIVSIGVHSDVLDFVARYRPVSIILVNERGQDRPGRPWENNEIDGIRNAMGASPKTLWIFRSWPDGIQEGPDDWTLAARIWKCFEPFKDMHNPKMGHSFNEPGFPWIGSSGDAERLAAMEEGFAKSMHDQGLLSMNFCFSESHILKGNMGLWSIYAEALPFVDALGFNEYDWPWVLTSRDQGYKWRIGHYEHQLLEISKHCSNIPPIIIGEGILDGKIQFPNPYGWQKRWKPEKYIEMHQQVYDDTYHRPGVFSHHTYCRCGLESEWRSYNVAPILSQLGQLIQNPVYWNDYVYPGVNKPDLPNKEEANMTIPQGWEKVPEKIRQWYPILSKQQWVFSYPIIKYLDNDLCVDRIGACIIKIESGGDPKAVGGAGQAHGLMQVWKNHYPALDLFAPTVNIKTGLQILKSKLGTAKGNLKHALYYYSGGTAWASLEGYTQTYWQPFARCYREWFGDNLDPELPFSNEIQTALQKIREAKISLSGAEEDLLRVL